jgi:hypothetical protein
MPANYKIPAHNHPTTEYVTVLSGDFHIGWETNLTPKKGNFLHVGGFAEASAKMNHYAWSARETVVLLQSLSTRQRPGSSYMFERRMKTCMAWSKA